MARKNKDGYVLKSEVQLIIQNYIRNIQMNDDNSDEGITQLYKVMDMIDKLDVDSIKTKDICKITNLPCCHCQPVCGSRGN